MRSILSLLAVVVIGCSGADEPESDATYRVLAPAEVAWEQLNPARGDKSPQAGTLWGSRTGHGPSGFLLKPVDGFRSPPHIHTMTYYGVVIRGTIHNAEPSEKDVFLPAGSYWAQPGGGIHITAARGSALAYIEVEGAFDVLPPEKATGDIRGSGTLAADIQWSDAPGGARMVKLWGDELSRALIELPAGFDGTIRGGKTVHGVVILGNATHREPGKEGGKSLEPGGYFGSEGNGAHRITCAADEPCVVYIRTDGAIEINRSSGS